MLRRRIVLYTLPNEAMGRLASIVLVDIVQSRWLVSIDSARDQPCRVYRLRLIRGDGGYSVKINQVNFSYSPLEDRLLFRFNTLNKTEFRMWLTRAMSIKLLGQLHQVVKVNLLRERPELGAAAMQTVGDFRREVALTKADYVQSFSSGAEIFPLGSQPILVTDIIMDSSKPVSVVTFQLTAGQRVSLSLDHDLGVAISKLLSNVVEGLDWGLGMAKELPVADVGNLSEKMMLH